MTPRHYSLPFLPATPLSPSQTLEGFFWADMAAFKGPHLASCIGSGAIEKQGQRHVCRARHRSPRTLSKNNWRKLDCVFVK